MSTKCSIKFGEPNADAPGFHLYEECFEDDYVYLELFGHRVVFNTCPEEAMMAIPVEVMDQIAAAWVQKRTKEKVAP
jgi:hypothetical protein